MVDPELRKIEGERQEDLQRTSSDYADYYVSEYDEVRQEIYRDGNRPLTVKEAAVIRAYQAVQTRRRKVPSTLNTLWNEYLQFRGVAITTRDGARIQGRWNNLMLVMRDVKISEHTPDHIEVGIDEFVEKELSRGQKPSSIDRNLREPIACFRWANRKHKLKWRPVEIPMLPKQKAKERKPLPNEDQQMLVRHCFDSNDWVGAAMLVMLQGGCMPSELARLRPSKDVNLKSEIPHIVISGGDLGITKREARKRIVPIVLGFDVISQNLEESIERLSKSKDPSATISKRLRTHVGPNYSSHCLRHTFRLNGFSSGANPQYLEAIGGWSGSHINKIMLNYGAAGTEYSEVLVQLRNESLKTHKHLLDTIDLPTS